MKNSTPLRHLLAQLPMPVMLCLAMVLSLSAGAHAQNIVKDGSFEVPKVVQGSAKTYAKGQSFDAGDWTVTGGTVTLANGSSWAAEDGTQSLELGPATGTQSSGISGITQTLNTSGNVTNKNKYYDVSFWIASDPNGGPTTKSGTVTFGTVTQTFSTSNQPNATQPHAGYQLVSFLFTNTGSATTALSFAGLAGGAYGIILDGISVQAVPEVGTILGFVVLLVLSGVLLRKKQAQTPTIAV